jgi:hypothetical protein
MLSTLPRRVTSCCAHDRPAFTIALGYAVACLVAAPHIAPAGRPPLLPCGGSAPANCGPLRDPLTPTRR